MLLFDSVQTFPLMWYITSQFNKWQSSILCIPKLCLHSNFSPREFNEFLYMIIYIQIFISMLPEWEVSMGSHVLSLALHVILKIFIHLFSLFAPEIATEDAGKGSAPSKSTRAWKNYTLVLWFTLCSSVQLLRYIDYWSNMSFGNNFLKPGWKLRESLQVLSISCCIFVPRFSLHLFFHFTSNWQ